MNMSLHIDPSDVAKTVKELGSIMKAVKEMEVALSEVEELVEGENAELAITKVGQGNWNTPNFFFQKACL